MSTNAIYDSLRLDHVIVYGADQSLSQIKEAFREHGITPSSGDRTDIGFGVHAAYFQVGDVVFEVFSVTGPENFKTARGTMPFSEELRRTKAAFGIGYLLKNVGTLYRHVCEIGFELRKPHSESLHNIPEFWTYLILDNVFQGSAPFVYSCIDADHGTKWAGKADGLGLGRLRELWFVSKHPMDEMGRWSTVFSAEPVNRSRNLDDERALSLEGRVLRWMTPEVYRQKSGKNPPLASEEKYGQLSAFVFDRLDESSWARAIGVSRFPAIAGEGFEGLHLNGDLDLTILTQTPDEQG